MRVMTKPGHLNGDSCDLRGNGRRTAPTRDSRLPAIRNQSGDLGSASPELGFVTHRFAFDLQTVPDFAAGVTDFDSEFGDLARKWLNASSDGFGSCEPLKIELCMKHDDSRMVGA